MELNELYNIWFKSTLTIETITHLAFLSEGLTIPEQYLIPLETQGFIRLVNTEVIILEKAKLLFPKINTKIDFDEFWEVFPSKTNKGRTLRSENKLFHNSLTNDYKTCKSKYLSKVKTIDLHNHICNIVKARADSDTEFMNNMETYINKQVWQQDVKYLQNNNFKGSML